MAAIFPDYYANGVSKIGERFLQDRQIQAIWLDIDNTISLVDDPLPTPEAREWISKMQTAGYTLGVVSNNDLQRVQSFAESMGLLFQAHAQKPSPTGYQTLAERAGLSPKQCLVVGDQLFTDILGGNNAGMYTVAVPPLEVDQEPKSFWIRRKMEQILIALHKKLLGKSLSL